MRIIEDLIEKMLLLHEQFRLRKFTLRNIWVFYKCYNLSLNILGLDDKDSNKKSQAFYNLIYAVKSGNVQLEKKYESYLMKCISKDMNVVSIAMSIMQDEISSSDQSQGFWKKGVIGVQDYEFIQVK